MFLFQFPFLFLYFSITLLRAFFIYIYMYYFGGLSVFVYLETSCAKYIFEKEIDLRPHLAVSNVALRETRDRFYTI